ncbi:MAG TPA: M20 family metallopeptidase [Bacillota bacterium]
MREKIHQTIDHLFPEMVDIRRHLHQYPELSFQEYETARYIAQYYKKLGIPYKTGVGGNGVIATLKGEQPGKTIALRADFDALPIHDEKDAPYRSKVDGVMHACGHDGHTATLLVLAKVLKQYKNLLPGTVVFLHQHAEEYAPGGAKPIIQSGTLDDVDAVFGTHLWATVPVGKVQTSKGAFMAGVDRFKITLQGQGGHGAHPHETKDALVIGAQLVNQLQQIVSRRLNPLDTAVVTIGKFEAGTAFNIISDKAYLEGTVRYLKTTTQERIIDEMEKITKGLCVGNDMTYTLEYEKGYPPLVNHEDDAELVLQSSRHVADVYAAEEVPPVMSGEDFAYYTIEKRGAFFFTGAQKEGHPYPHHHPKFDIDERALPIAAKLLIETYFAYQEKASTTHS